MHADGDALSSLLMLRMGSVLDTYRNLSDALFRMVHGRGYRQVLFSLAYLALILVTQPHSFNENDSVVILRALEAGIETPFMALALAKVFSFCYLHISPALPWYPCFLYALHVMGISLFIGAVYASARLRYYALPLLLVYLSIYLIFILRVGYNGAAIMIGANALFAGMVSLQQDEAATWRKYALYGTLFACSYLVRQFGILDVLVFSAPVLALAILDGARSRKIALGVAFALPAVLVIFFNLYLEKYQSTPQYRQFLEFNAIRGKIHGFPIEEAGRANRRLLVENHWTAADYRAFENWFYLDERKFNAATLQRVLAYPPPHAVSAKPWANTLPKFLRQYQYYLPAFVLACLFLGLACPRPGWLAGVVLYQFYALGGMLFMEIYYRFPDRIGIPTLALCFLNSIFPAFRKPAGSGGAVGFGPGPGRGLIALVAACLVIWWGAGRVLREIDTIRSGRAAVRQVLPALNALPGKSFVVSEPRGGLRLEYLDPLATYGKQVRAELIPLGWATFSPLFYHTLQGIGVGDGQQLLAAMVDNPQAYLFLSTTGFAEIILAAVEAEVGFGCTLRRIRYMNDEASLYQIHRGGGERVFPWRLLAPGLVQDPAFPWHDYLFGKSFQWGGSR